MTLISAYHAYLSIGTFLSIGVILYFPCKNFIKLLSAGTLQQFKGISTSPMEQII
jgi:hypothetical protein